MSKTANSDSEPFLKPWLKAWCTKIKRERSQLQILQLREYSVFHWIKCRVEHPLTPNGRPFTKMAVRFREKTIRQWWHCKSGNLCMVKSWESFIHVRKNITGSKSTVYPNF